jgi:hypothetical protein
MHLQNQMILYESECRLDHDQRNVVFETYSVIPLAHKMSLEQFLNTPVESLKSMAKGLCREMRVVG